MAMDAFLALVDQTGKLVTSESQVTSRFVDPFPGRPALTGAGAVFELIDYAFDVEQTLNIGSQSTGAGAGKITFNPFSITRQVDRISPLLFQMSASGATFKTADLLLCKSGGDTSDVVFLAFGFSLVAVKTIAWSHADEGITETVTFQYGGLEVAYAAQNPDGTLGTFDTRGWDRVKNVAWTG